MHYRLPFYERLCLDSRFKFRVFHGRGEMGTKLQNTKLSDSAVKSTLVKDWRIRVGRVSIPFSPFLLCQLLLWRPEVILSEGASSLLNATQVFFYSKLMRKRIIWWSLGSLKGKKYTGWRGVIHKWELFIAKHSDAIFTYSNQGRQFFLDNGVPSERIFIAVNVLDTEKKLKEIKSCSHLAADETGFGEFNVAFIGTITPEKNLEVLIDAILMLNRKHGDRFSLHVIGDGQHMDKLRGYAGGSSRVVLHGRINHGASQILGRCQVMVLPGLGGLAIYEGMLNRLPVISGYADGTEHDLIDKSNGFVLDKISADIICEKVEYLYMNADIRDKMAEASFTKATESITFEHYYEKFVKSVNYVMESR